MCDDRESLETHLWEVYQRIMVSEYINGIVDDFLIYQKQTNKNQQEDPYMLRKTDKWKGKMVETFSSKEN